MNFSWILFLKVTLRYYYQQKYDNEKQNQEPPESYQRYDCDNNKGKPAEITIELVNSSERIQ